MARWLSAIANRRLRVASNRGNNPGERAVTSIGFSGLTLDRGGWGMAIEAEAARRAADSDDSKPWLEPDVRVVDDSDETKPISRASSGGGGGSKEIGAAFAATAGGWRRPASRSVTRESRAPEEASAVSLPLENRIAFVRP